jgi:hypothetical protein
MKLEFRDSFYEGKDSADAIKCWRNLLGPSKLFPNMYDAHCRGPNKIVSKNIRQLFALSDTRNFGLYLINNMY